MTKRILFYSSVRSLTEFNIQNFYKIDIKILEDLGYDVKLSNKIKDFFKVNQYDIGFLYFYRYSFFAAALCKLFNKYTVFTGGIDNLDSIFASRKRYLIQYVFFKLCNLLSDCSIIVSNADLNNIRKIYNGHIPHNCTLSMHAIEIDKYLYDGRKKEKIITSIAWMGSIDNVLRKGIDRTIMAFAVFLKNNPDFKLMLIGKPGDGSIYILNLIAKLNLQDSVIYLGAVTDKEKIELLKKSLIYSQLSIYEGFGLACIEAMAAGNIVIHSGNGGLKDAVGNCGYTVNIDSIDDIVSAYELAAQVDTYNIRIKQGIDYVTVNFSYKRRLYDFKNILNKF